MLNYKKIGYLAKYQVPKYQQGNLFTMIPKLNEDPKLLSLLQGFRQLMDLQDLEYYMQNSRTSSPISKLGKPFRNMPGMSEFKDAWNENSGNIMQVGFGALNALSPQIFGEVEQSESMDTLNQALDMASAIPGIGAYATAAKFAINAVNTLGGSTAQNFSADSNMIESVGSAYGGSVDKLNSAASKAGKKYGLFSGGAGKINKEIDLAKILLDKMRTVDAENRDRMLAATLVSDINHSANSFNMAGGYDLRYNRVAKEGMKFDEWEPTIEPYFEPTITEYKEGGKAPTKEVETPETKETTLKSVIPDGALHKNKHHLDEVGIDTSELTKKGVPVVDNDGNLQAEIEREELILSLEITLAIEDRYSEYYKEDTKGSRKKELALEAGKILWKELMTNLDDRAGIVDSLKEGGILKALNGGTINQLELEDAIRKAMLNIFTK